MIEGIPSSAVEDAQALDVNRTERDTTIVRLRGSARTRLEWLVSSAIDAGFLVLWAALQYLTDAVLSELDLTRTSTLTASLLIAFQMLFAVSLLLPVLLWIWCDTYVMYCQARERMKAKGNE